MHQFFKVAPLPDCLINALRLSVAVQPGSAITPKAFKENSPLPVPPLVPVGEK